MSEPHTRNPEKVKALHLNRTFRLVKRRPAAGYTQLELSMSTTLNGLTFYASTFVDGFGPIVDVEHELARSLMGEIRRVLFAGTEL